MVGPLMFPADGKNADLSVPRRITYKLAEIFPDAVENDLYLHVKYQSADASNPNLAFQNNVAIMKALVAKYPEIKGRFRRRGSPRDRSVAIVTTVRYWR